MAPRRHEAGLFDIRNIIGGLLLVYGVILLVMGLFADQAHDRTGGVNANLWAGIALLVVGGAMVGWAFAKPVMVPEDVDASDDESRPAGH